jgi:predicted Zn-dependent protease
MISIRTTRVFQRTAIALAAVALLAGSGCAVNPVSGKRQINLVSTNRELDMGREADPAIIAEYGLYGDDATQSYVDSVGQRLARVSHLPNLTFHFRVLDTPVVNAFALPGGYVYITRGIMAYVNSESQLAGILGHEIGHVTARHTAQQVTQQQISGPTADSRRRGWGSSSSSTAATTNRKPTSSASSTPSAPATTRARFRRPTRRSNESATVPGARSRAFSPRTPIRATAKCEPANSPRPRWAARRAVS